MTITARTGLAAAVGLAALLVAQSAAVPTAGAATPAVPTAGAATPAVPIAAAPPALDRPVAYARDGAIFTSTGAAERRLTGPDDNGRPRLAPDRRTVAYLHAGELWQMNADGGRKHRVTAGRAAGAAYSPDGQWLAYAAPACTGGPGVYRVRARAPHGRPEVLFPAQCRAQAVPAPTPATGAGAGVLAERLRYDDAVAWSPDGSRIAFRAGDCASLYDDCLSIGTVATGAQRTVAGFGGGGAEDGYAVLPAWRTDGGTLAWTEYSADSLHVVEAAADGTARRQVGAAQDRDLVYVGTDRALITGQYRGRPWILLLDLATGQRVPVRPGSQPSV